MHREEFPYRASDYTIEIMPQPTTDGQMIYFASIEELPGCNSDGETPDEARGNLEDAFDLYVTTSLLDGVTLPAPSPSRQYKEVIWREISFVAVAPQP